MRVKSRQRSIDFNGRTITITLETKGFNTIKNTLPIDKVEISHSKPGWGLGKIRFTAPGANGHAIVKLPWLADKEDQFTFVYGTSKQKEVDEFLAAVDKARGRG